MADLIDRAALMVDIAASVVFSGRNNGNAEIHGANKIIDRIKSAPTVDVVDVVRCRDCKHYDTADFDGDILCGCTLPSAMLDITPDSFCSYGERKEGANNG